MEPNHRRGLWELTSEEQFYTGFEEASVSMRPSDELEMLKALVVERLSSWIAHAQYIRSRQHLLAAHCAEYALKSSFFPDLETAANNADAVIGILFSMDSQLHPNRFNADTD